MQFFEHLIFFLLYKSEKKNILQKHTFSIIIWTLWNICKLDCKERYPWTEVNKNFFYEAEW